MEKRKSTLSAEFRNELRRANVIAVKGLSHLKDENVGRAILARILDQTKKGKQGAYHAQS
ncbi:MAG: hypothetical protein NTX50_00315 [Candidatus Sumerlaeota bacterium]|nr:hypothetical protein [Candidatus Sumerlaeota bacterium]